MLIRHFLNFKYSVKDAVSPIIKPYVEVLKTLPKFLNMFCIFSFFIEALM